jgi:hypothetical protein
MHNYWSVIGLGWTRVFGDRDERFTAMNAVKFFNFWFLDKLGDRRLPKQDLCCV